MPTRGAVPHGPSANFRGWLMVLVAVLGQCLSLGPMLVYTFGVFAKPLTTEFKTSRGAISLALTLTNLMVAVGAPGAGWLVDHLGARRVITCSILAFTACLLALSGVTTSLWHFYVLYAMAGVLAVGATPVTYSRVIANWFDQRRGIALGISSAGIGLGAFVLPSLAQYLIGRAGWRQAYLVLGGLSLAVAAPVVGVFLRGRPQDVGQLPDVTSKARQRKGPPGDFGISILEASRTRTFWQLCGAFFCVSACVNGAIAHLSPLLTDQGVSGRNAALATSLFGAATILGRVGNGYLVDRFFAPSVAATFFGAAALGLALLVVGLTGGTAFVAAFLMGLGIGAEADVMPFLVSRYFGMRCMGELFGCIFASYTLGVAVGPYLIGAGFDWIGSYRHPLACALGALLVAIVATLHLGEYQRPQNPNSELAANTPVAITKSQSRG